MADGPTFFIDGTGRLRTVWRFALFGLGALAIIIGVNVAVAVAAVIYLQSQGHPIDEVTRLLEERVVELQIIITPVLLLLALGLVAACRRWLDRRSFRSLGMEKAPTAVDVVGGTLVGFGLIAFSVLMLWMLGALQYGSGSVTGLTVMLTLTLVLAAYTEELVTRGYLLQNLLDIDRPVTGVVVSSLFFWLGHSANPAAWSSFLVPLNLFGAGILLALAYMVSRNLWFPTALHFGWNFTQGVLFGLPVSGAKVGGIQDWEIDAAAATWLTGGEFGLEGSVLTTAVEVALIAVFLLLLARRPGTRAPGTSAPA